jgi:tRNA uridine 5-carbamoylmethylation protein Kti12
MPEDVPLKDYTDALTTALQRQLDEIRREREQLLNQVNARSEEDRSVLQGEFNRRLMAIDEATKTAKGEMNIRLEGMNELRRLANDVQANKLDKDTFAAEMDRLRDSFIQQIELIRKDREALGVRVRDLEGNTASASAIEGYKRWLIATGLVVAGLAIVVIFNFVSLHK